MKVLIKYWFFFASVLLFSCSNENTPFNPNSGVITENSLNSICMDWGADSDNVKSHMINYRSLENTDENVMQFIDKGGTHKICYEFIDGKLRAAMLTYVKEAHIDSKNVFNVNNYKYIGETDGASIYTNNSSNTMCILMEKSGGNSNSNMVLGFTPMKSDLYDSYEPIILSPEDPSNLEALRVTLNCSYSGTETIGYAYFYTSDSSDMSSAKKYAASKKDKLISATISTTVPNITLYYYAEIQVGGVWYQSSVESLKMPEVKTYALGDPYPDASNPIGVVCKITNSGLNGTIVSLDQDYIKWDNNGIFCTDYSAYNSSDGSKNNIGTTQPFGSWVAKHGSGWFGPARYQLSFSKSNLAAINKGLRSLNKTELDGFYWSSTQRDNNTAWVVTVTENGYMGYSNQYDFYNSKDENRLVRAMKYF